MYRHLRRMTAKTRPRLGSATGQGLVEYALILALVAVLAIGGLTILGGGIKGVLNGVGVNAGGGGAVPSGEPTFYGSENACEAAGFQWIDPQGSNNAYCNNQPRPPGTFHDDDDCEDAGFFWYNNSCHAAADPYPRVDGQACDANGGVWDRHGNSWDCNHPTPRGTPPPPNPASRLGTVCDFHNGPDEYWHWDVHWDGDGSGHWETDWDCRYN